MSRTQRRLPVAVAILAAALLVTLAGAGSVLGTAQAAALAAAPANTAAPTETGTVQEGQTLTALNGTWTGTPAPSFRYSWERCDSNAANCVAIAGATAQTYKLMADDIGHTVRINVTGSNRSGDASAASSPTGLVAASTTATTVAIADVTLPNHLTVDQVTYSPSPVTSRASAVTVRFHVSDSAGRSVVGALVYVIGVPYNRVPVLAEQPTGADGWVQFQFTPTAKFPIVKGGSQILFVRARAPQDPLLGGVSTRRLVQFSVTTP